MESTARITVDCFACEARLTHCVHIGSFSHCVRLRTLLVLRKRPVTWGAAAFSRAPSRRKFSPPAALNPTNQLGIGVDVTLSWLPSATPARAVGTRLHPSPGPKLAKHNLKPPVCSLPRRPATPSAYGECLRGLINVSGPSPFNRNQETTTPAPHVGAGQPAPP